MKGNIALTPDELAQIVGWALMQSGIDDVEGLALYSAGQMVGFDQAVVQYGMPEGLDLDRVRRKNDLQSVLYPNIHTSSLKS